MHYLGLGIHKKTISYCVREADGSIVAEGTFAATREALTNLLQGLPQPWAAGLEATMFRARIYDHIRAQAGSVKVAHSMMVQAIAAGKRKNDRVDARKISDLPEKRVNDPDFHCALSGSFIHRSRLRTPIPTALAASSTLRCERSAAIASSCFRPSLVP
jgi:Transposase